MKQNIIKKLMLFFICIFLIVPSTHAISWGDSDNSLLLLAKNDKHKHKTKKKHNTQVHTHTHTQTQTRTIIHNYYYYPGSQVYFNPGQKLYFYRVGNEWKKSVKLPQNIIIKPGDIVNLKLDTDKPYLKFEQHKIEFPMQREFQFFPSVQVYFDPLAKTWFHLEGTSWKKYTKLPDNIAVTDTETVVLNLDTDEPYKYYEVHKVKYKHKHKQ